MNDGLLWIRGIASNDARAEKKEFVVANQPIGT